MRRLPDVPFHLPVADRNHAVGVGRDVGFVCDHDDGVAAFMETREQRHDLDAGLRIEIPGGFIGEQNRWIVHQRSRNGDALALTAGQLVRLVVHAMR